LAVTVRRPIDNANGHHRASRTSGSRGIPRRGGVGTLRDRIDPGIWAARDRQTRGCDQAIGGGTGVGAPGLAYLAVAPHLGNTYGLRGRSPTFAGPRSPVVELVG